MKKRLLIPISALLLTGFALSSCSTVKQDVDQRRKDREAEATETTPVTETEATTEETTEATTEETTTEATTEPEPSIVTIESNVYTDAEAPIVIDWDNYQNASSKPSDTNVFTRMSEEYIDEFVPSEEYGAVFPYLAFSSYGHMPTADNDFVDEFTARNARFTSYGLCDSQGRIICDPVFRSALYIKHSVIMVSQGEYPNEKYGLIDSTGSKFTQLIYDDVDFQNDYIYARTAGNLSIFDNDLNLIKQVSYKIDDDLFGYEIKDEYLIFEGLPDDDHALVNLGQGQTYILDFNTGKLIGDGTAKIYADPAIFIGGPLGEVRLYDIDGNPLSDVYSEYVRSVYKTPIVCDKDGMYYALNSEGQVIKEFGKLTHPGFCEYKDYTVRYSDDKTVVYDKDFNEVAEFDLKCTYVIDWKANTGTYKPTFLPDAEPFVVSGNDLINAITGEVLAESARDIDFVYLIDDLYAGVRDEVGSAIYLKDGKKIALGSKDSYRIVYDNTSDTPYIICSFSDHIEVCNPRTDSTVRIEDTFDVDYGTYINNNTLYHTDDTRNVMYSLEDQSLIFNYYVADPIGD